MQMNLLCEAKLLDRPGWQPGRMTTEHAASSYGLPVLILDDDSGPRGPGDAVMAVRLLDATEEHEAAVDRAGYRVLPW